MSSNTISTPRVTAPSRFGQSTGNATDKSSLPATVDEQRTAARGSKVKIVPGWDGPGCPYSLVHHKKRQNLIVDPIESQPQGSLRIEIKDLPSLGTRLERGWVSGVTDITIEAPHQGHSRRGRSQGFHWPNKPFLRGAIACASTFRNSPLRVNPD